MPKAMINGVNLHYHVSGRGVPILFIHPPLLTSSIFNYQRTELAESCKVITFDIRGHGRSDPSEQPITYELIAEDMKQLLDYLGVEQAYVCGYSTGGGIALHAMLSYPDRYLGGILLSAMSEVSDWWLKSRLTIATTLMQTKLSQVLNMGISWGNKDSYQTYKQLFGTAKHGDPRNIMEYYAYSKAYSCTKQLPQIKQPILLAYGQKDRSFYRYAEILHHLLPSSSLYFMRNVGHQLPTKAGDRVNRLMRQWIMMQLEARNGEGVKEKMEFQRSLEQLSMYGNEWNEDHIHSERDL